VEAPDRTQFIRRIREVRARWTEGVRDVVMEIGAGGEERYSIRFN
jgi:hypothetical protein